MQEMGEQRPLEAQHVPAQDFITAAHGSQPLSVLDAVPGGHNGARLHWDGAFTWSTSNIAHTKVTAFVYGKESVATMSVRADAEVAHVSPFSTLVRSLPCLAFSNRG